MKKIIFFAVIAAIIATTGASCDKIETSSAVQSGEVCSLITVSIAGNHSPFGINVPSKASINADNEVKVNSVQVFVFNGDGTLDSYVKSSSATGIRARCTNGSKTIYALANAPDLSEIVSKSELEGTTSKLSDNTLNSFVMIGSKTADVPSSGDIVIDVGRMVARISLMNISTDFASKAYADMTFTVKRIFMTNVAGDTDYAKSASPETWYNKREYYSSDMPDFLATGEIGKTVTSPSTYSANEHFYVYPNPTTTDSHSYPFTPRFTRLVVEATLGQATYYYPINIQGIESNKTYSITNLKITRPGTSHPDEELVSEDCSFSIDVSDWEVGLDTEITI